ncbi:hypothetical protein llap_12832 [Limosa lapponica baueri]|uniref:Uncharacterized protein n=1 Tax=Limosa lapponica baueri TaxID=1758121 RepID=A0A2I0TSZ2_LIMLA|nr:hypothetical protein llap_12832 [Limosa lapponica baueri]
MEETAKMDKQEPEGGGAGTSTPGLLLKETCQVNIKKRKKGEKASARLGCLVSALCGGRTLIAVGKKAADLPENGRREKL